MQAPYEASVAPLGGPAPQAGRVHATATSGAPGPCYSHERAGPPGRRTRQLEELQGRGERPWLRPAVGVVAHAGKHVRALQPRHQHGPQAANEHVNGQLADVGIRHCGLQGERGRGRSVEAEGERTWHRKV